MDIAEIRKKARLLDLREEKPAGASEGPSILEEIIAPSIELPEQTETKTEPAFVPEIEPLPQTSTTEETRMDAPEEPNISVEPAGLKDIVPETLTLHKPEVFDEEEAGRGIKEEAADGEVEAIVFSLDNEEYGVDIHQVKEVIKVRELTEVPKAPRDIMGVISLRGVVIPIMNLRGRFGMAMENKGERIIIVRDGAGLLGLLVDAVRHVVRLPEKSIEPPPPINTIDGELIKGIGRHKGGMFILIDMQKMLEMK